MKSYSVRLSPTYEQVNQLLELSMIRKEIWNKLLSIEKIEYETNKKILNKFDLNNLLPKLKEETPIWNKLNSKAIQTIATELYGSYRSFFNLIKKDKNARPPKEITDNYYHTLVFNQSGWSIKDNILIINKIPFIYKSNIDTKDLQIKELKIKYKNKKWLCDLIVDDKIEYKDNLNIKTKVLSIDLGLSKLGTGVDNDGNMIILKNISKEKNDFFQKEIKKVQAKLSNKKKDSRRYKKTKKVLNKLYKRKNTQIKQTLHIQSKRLVNMNYNTIVVGDLTVKRLMSTQGVNEKKKGVRKSFHHSNINMFLSFLKYKCQDKNINLVKIDEKWTTQINCLTGKLFNDRVELYDRIVKLNDQITIDRDLNSAINILNRWFDNHFASMNKPLDLSRVLKKYNIFEETTKSLV